MLFGGGDFSDGTNDTTTWDGNLWTALAPVIVPTARGRRDEDVAKVVAGDPSWRLDRVGVRRRPVTG